MGFLWGVLGEYLKTPLETPYWVNWMQTPNQVPETGEKPSPEMGEEQTQVSQIYADLATIIKKYVKLRHNDIKELGDLSLMIENFIDTVKEKMSQTWYDAHIDMTLRDLLIERLIWSGKATFHCSEYELLTDEFRKCVEEKMDMILNDVLTDPSHDDTIDFVLDLRYWGLENLTFMELETVNTIINEVLDYCMDRGYGPDDTLSDCFSTGDDA